MNLIENVEDLIKTGFIIEFIQMTIKIYTVFCSYYTGLDNQKYSQGILQKLY